MTTRSIGGANAGPVFVLGKFSIGDNQTVAKLIDAAVETQTKRLADALFSHICHVIKYDAAYKRTDPQQEKKIDWDWLAKHLKISEILSPSSWRLYSGLIVAGLLSGCAFKASPVQMYDGPALPKEQVAIVRSACKTGPGLTIMIVRIDDNAVSNGCAEFALLPGDHKLELSAKRLAPRMDTPMIRSGSALGAPPSPSGASASEELPVVWASTSPMPITCTIEAGEEVTIIGNVVTGSDWEAKCQRRSP